MRECVCVKCGKQARGVVGVTSEKVQPKHGVDGHGLNAALQKKVVVMAGRFAAVGRGQKPP